MGGNSWKTETFKIALLQYTTLPYTITFLIYIAKCNQNKRVKLAPLTEKKITPNDNNNKKQQDNTYFHSKHSKKR